jgi:Fe-S-cluster containining protein
MSKADARRADKERKAAQLGERRRVVLQVFQEADEAVDFVLGKLREAGTTPSCERGCVHCCFLEIPASRAEAETIVAWMREHRSADAMAAFEDRLRAWLAWYRGELPKAIAGGAVRGEGFLKTSPGCVMLEDGACSIYPVRPMTCRNHYVSSPPADCGPSAGRDSTVTGLAGIAQATRPITAAIRRVVESQGGNFEASIHLLPEWMAHLLDVEQDPWRA